MTDQPELFAPGGSGDGDETVTVDGEVRRITFHNEENGWTVLRVDTRDGPVTAVGTLPGVREGETMRFRGQWKTHPRFGVQLQVDSFLPLTPSTLDGVRRYLGSGLVPGIGPAFAERLVERFGDRTLDVIESEPRRLAEVPGIGPKRIARIRAAWGAQQAARDVLVFLQGHGISPAYAGRIYRRYGAEAMGVLRDNPYRLASDVAGIGFRRADEIARSVGIPADSPLRARAGVLHVLGQEADDGHTCTPRHDLVGRAARELGIEPPGLERACDDLLDGGQLTAHDATVALAPLDTAERAIADAVAAQLGSTSGHRPASAAELAAAESRCRIRLDPRQREAVERLIREPLAILTGGPGTGKTTCLRVFLHVIEQRRQTVLLAAPTGRAAKRMSEATDHPASTLHRLLAYSPRDDAFHRDAETPLRADVVIVDEVSMVDTLLFGALLDAVAPGTRLLLVGDADQLPSVGPGQVLGDLLRSRRVPAIRLQRIFRQADASGIVRAAHEVLGGGWPTSGRSADDDFFVIRREDPAETAETVRELVSRRIPDRFGLDPRRDVQVLTPMHRGLCGARALNEALQATLNPPAVGRGELTRGARTYRVGDRVMQVRNDYDRDVFNGDLGIVAEVDAGAGTLTLEIDGVRHEYAAGDLDQVVPAYAVSIHKSQGSEYPAVVIPLCGEHWVMLRRNLLYTAITRGARIVTVVGSYRALGRALERRERSGRRTQLVRYLAEVVPAR